MPVEHPQWLLRVKATQRRSSRSSTSSPLKSPLKTILKSQRVRRSLRSCPRPLNLRLLYQKTRHHHQCPPVSLQYRHLHQSRTHHHHLHLQWRLRWNRVRSWSPVPSLQPPRLPRSRSVVVLECRPRHLPRLQCTSGNISPTLSQQNPSDPP